MFPHIKLKAPCLVKYTRRTKFSGGINQCSSSATEQNQHVSAKEVVLHVPHFHTIAEKFVTPGNRAGATATLSITKKKKLKEKLMLLVRTPSVQMYLVMIREHITNHISSKTKIYRAHTRFIPVYITCQIPSNFFCCDCTRSYLASYEIYLSFRSKKRTMNFSRIGLKRKALEVRVKIMHYLE